MENLSEDVDDTTSRGHVNEREIKLKNRLGASEFFSI
jgi:hypothetical protein